MQQYLCKDFLPTEEKFQNLQNNIKKGTENNCRDSLIDFLQYLGNIHNIEVLGAFTEYHSFDGTRGDLVFYGIEHQSPAYLLGAKPAVSLTDVKAYLYECKNVNERIFTTPKKTDLFLQSS